MTNTPAVAAKTITSNYDNFKNWQNNNEKLDAIEEQCRDMEEVLDAQYKNGASEESIFGSELGQQYLALNDDFMALAAQTPRNFNFMEGNDASNSEAYKTQLRKLAQGDMLSKDKNGDGKISKKEYIASEIYDDSTVLTKEKKAQLATDASIMFDAIDSLVLTNSNPDDDTIDGNLSLSDLENLYKVLDGFNYDEAGTQMSFDGNFNGELDIDSFGAFMEVATASVTEEQQKALENDYLGIFDAVEKMTTKEA